MKLNSLSIEEELRKNAALKRTDIEALRQWCAERYYPPGTSDSDLAIFLHSSYYYLETAKSNIESYYAARQSLPQFFENRSTHSEELQKIFDTVAIVPLAKRTREAYKVLLIRPFDVERKNIVSSDAIKVFNMILDLSVHEEGTQEGYVLVVDVHGTNLFDPDSFDATAVKKYFEYLQKSAPIRLFGVHFVNTILPFPQKDRFSRLTIVQNDYVDAMYYHSDLDSLNEVVPLDILPNEMGGRAGLLKDLHAAQVAKLRRKSHWFSMMEFSDACARYFREFSLRLSTCLTTKSQDQKGAFLTV